MPSQLAVDLSRFRVRAVEIDGSAKSPKVKAFVAADVPPPPPPPAEGEAARPFSYGDALRDLSSQRRLAKEPSAVALASVDCTFRDLELPFTTPDQIDKVIKFEAESHLQLVEIDSVVVSYQILDSDGRGGSRLLAAACAKETIRSVLRDLSTIGVDPTIADLHLCALYTAMAATGYLVAPPPPPSDAPPSATPQGDVVLVLECDADITHVLVARGETLLAARAIRFGTVATHHEPAVESKPAEAAPGARATSDSVRHDNASRHDHDETMVVVDDLAPGGGDDAARHGRRGGGDYFARIKREVQRTLFRLGPAGEHVAQVWLLGAATRDADFVERMGAALAMPVEVARPFDRVEHELDGEALEAANAEGTAALGAALRLLGVQGGSRVEFRQEEVRYARRFDQVKVALSSLAIMALVCVALLCIERAKQYKVKQKELYSAANAVINEYAQHAETLTLTQKVNRGEVKPLDAVQQAKNELNERLKVISSELGRSGSIPRLVSGLDYLNAVVGAIEKDLAKIGRIEINTIDLDVGRDGGQKPQLKMRMMLNGPAEVDALCAALRASPAVKEAPTPSTNPAKDGRLEVTNFDIDLKPDFDPRRAAKEAVK